MNIITALRKGIGLASRHWRALLVVYVFNLALAGAAAVPVFRAIDAELSHTESAEQMAEGFDWLWFEEFRASRNPGEELSVSLAPWQQGLAPLIVNFERYVRGSLRRDLPSPLIWLGILYLLITTFLTGGILGLFAEEDVRFSLRFFFDRAGRYFIILLGILVVATLAYWLLWDVIGTAWRGLVANVRGEATTEWTPVLLDWLGALILVIAAFLFGRFLPAQPGKGAGALLPYHTVSRPDRAVLWSAREVGRRGIDRPADRHGPGSAGLYPGFYMDPDGLPGRAALPLQGCVICSDQCQKPRKTPTLIPIPDRSSLGESGIFSPFTSSFPDPIPPIL